MYRILHPLFALQASVTHLDLARQVAYLKAENKILRERLDYCDPMCDGRHSREYTGSSCGVTALTCSRQSRVLHTDSQREPSCGFRGQSWDFVNAWCHFQSA